MNLDDYLTAAEQANYHNAEVRDRTLRLESRNKLTADDAAEAGAARWEQERTINEAATAWRLATDLGTNTPDELAAALARLERLELYRSIHATLFSDPATNQAHTALFEGDNGDWDSLLAATPWPAFHHTEPEPELWPIATTDQINAVLSGDYQPPVPSILQLDDAEGLLYPGKVHSLGGEPGGGKTWVALHAATQQLNTGHNVLLIDFEDRLDTAVRRLIALGTDPNQLRNHFRYVSPQVAIIGGGLPTNIINETANNTTLVIIDSMGEALAHSHLEQNDDGDVADWMTKVARRLADQGAAVLILDHVTKDAEHRGRYNIGSQRKLAAIDGAAYQLKTSVAATRDATGRATITCSKDRQGYYQHGTPICDVTFTPDGDLMGITMTSPRNITDTGETLLTGYMEKISRLLEDGLSLSGRAVVKSITGNDPHIRTALRQLIEGGWVSVEPGDRGAHVHHSIKPYREFDTPTASTASTASTTASNPTGRGTASTASTASTTASGRGGEELQNDRVHRVHDFRSGRGDGREIGVQQHTPNTTSASTDNWLDW